MNDSAKIDEWREYLYYTDPDFRTAADTYGSKSKQATKAMLLALTDMQERMQKEMEE